MLNGLDLFSGIGGITLALSGYVRPIVYCENERYAQGVLLSRMADGCLPCAPIWDDVRTFDGRTWEGRIDIISGGFPCQDLSYAGAGRGLAGERSGLVFEIFRLLDQIRPPFLFLENVPAIRTRGAARVVEELARRGYVCRWKVVSAEEVGANHQRKRWFLLAYADRFGLRNGRKRGEERQAEAGYLAPHDGAKEPLADSDLVRWKWWSGDGDATRIDESPDGGKAVANADGGGQLQQGGAIEELGRRACDGGSQGELSDADRAGLEERSLESSREELPTAERGSPVLYAESFGRLEGVGESEVFEGRYAPATGASWWTVEPDVGRVAYGVPQRVDRIKGLGNAVVPLQARGAFEILAGLR